MKRRDLLKNLTMAAGGAMLSRESAAQTDKQPVAKNSTVIPIRGLVRKEGQLVQPIQITIEKPGDAVMAVTKLDDTEIDRRTLSTGAKSFEIYVKPVTSNQRSTIIVDLGEKEVREEIELKPVRQMQIYVLPHSHHDLGYTEHHTRHRACTQDERLSRRCEVRLEP
jgi:alpha-mannosidase